MQPKTIQLFGTLEVLCDSDSTPLLWDAETQGEFSPWRLMISEGFVKQTDPELVFEHWQKIERWGTPTDVTEYEYAPLRSERQAKDWNEAIAGERQVIYQKIQALLKNELQHQEAFKLSVAQHRFEWDHPDFFVSLLVGELSDGQWLCLAPIVPDQVGWYLREVKSKSAGTSSSYAQTTQAVAESPFLSQLSALLNQLHPIELYGYYHGGYDYSYTHRIVKGIAPTKALAIQYALESAEMLVVQQSTNISAGSPKILQFMNKCLSDYTLYSLSFWDLGYGYKFGRTPDNDWIGTRSFAEFEYNP